MSAPDLAAMSPAAAWAWLAGELTAATASARHPLHLATLATIGADGAPQARTVVLRYLDTARGEIRFHTDIRSPKVAAMRHDPRVALHWYDPAMRVQVRIPAVATIHHGDAVAVDALSRSAAMSRACYAAAHGPGTTLAEFPSSPTAPAEGDDAPLLAFAVVACRFDAVELLCLHAVGHQRVRLHVAQTPVTWDVLAP
ncbi:MAG: pyridoxamine 5'-phosphate oxidase family protein [Planctomycetaceae bacterium]